MRIEFLSDAHRISKRCPSNFKTMPIEQTGERGIPPAKPRIYGVTKPSWPYRKGNGAVFTSYTHGFAIASLYFDQGQVLLFHAPRYMGLSRHVTLAQTDMSPSRKQTCLLRVNRHVSFAQADMSPWIRLPWRTLTLHVKPENRLAPWGRFWFRGRGDWGLGMSL